MQSVSKMGEVNPESPISLDELTTFTQTHANLIERHDRQIAGIIEVFTQLIKSIEVDFQFIRVEVLKQQADDYQAVSKYTNRELLQRVEELQSKTDYLTDKLFEKKDRDPLKTSAKL
jgi:Mg2+ and Co2+ transporter CorA